VPIVREDAAPSLVRLLDLDPEIGARLREDDRAEARERLVLMTTVLPTGEWAPTAADARAHRFGLIVVDGLLLQEVRLAGRASQQLLGPGDIVLPQPARPDALAPSLRLIVASEARVALLDDRLQAPFRLWPGLALGLFERIGCQLSRSAVHAAIAQLPRVEDRLEATFWDLAERWGRVTPVGIHIPLTLTHEALARIVGGRRPTISLALSDLAERGIVARSPDGTWMLTAREPSLPHGEGGPPAVPTSAPPPIALVREPAAAAPAPEHHPWMPAARAELLATAERVSAEHAVATARVDDDRDRYEQTRSRSRALREQTAREREARARDRATLMRRPAPPAPSAG
jgi:CRP-like cAMP-binding protein